MTYCSRCGKEVKDGMRFCPNCGKSMYTVEKTPVRAEPAQKYKLRIVRPSSFFGVAMAHRIHIDGQPKEYMLKNGETVEIELTPGEHTIEISMTAVLKKTRARITMNSDRTLTCRINPKGTMTNGTLSGPAILEDESGKRVDN